MNTNSSQRVMIAICLGSLFMLLSIAMFVISRSPGRHVPAPVWFDQWVLPGVPLLMGIAVLVTGVVVYFKQRP